MHYFSEMRSQPQSAETAKDTTPQTTIAVKLPFYSIYQSPEYETEQLPEEPDRPFSPTSPLTPASPMSDAHSDAVESDAPIDEDFFNNHLQLSGNCGFVLGLDTGDRHDPVSDDTHSPEIVDGDVSVQDQTRNLAACSLLDKADYVYEVVPFGDDTFANDEFPYIHEFTTAWRFVPSARPFKSGGELPTIFEDSASASEGEDQLPTIMFHPSPESNPSHTWVPLQDSDFGRQLTVLDHYAVNVVHPPMALDALASGSDLAGRYNPYSGTGVTVMETLRYTVDVIHDDWSLAWEWSHEGRWKAVANQVTDAMLDIVEEDEEEGIYFSRNLDLRRRWSRKLMLDASLSELDLEDEEVWACAAAMEEEHDLLDMINGSPDLDSDYSQPTTVCHAPARAVEIYDPDAEEELPDLTGW